MYILQLCFYHIYVARKVYIGRYLRCNQNAHTPYVKNEFHMKLSIYYNARYNHLSLDTQRSTCTVHD